MTHWFHPEADGEFCEAVAYYEACQEGLGQDFYAEINLTIGRILDLPNAWPVFDGDVRRCLAHRFPYGVLYSIELDGIFILAVMHLRRDPDYWKQRR
jgi:toxin ParE1/3/4